MGCCTIGGGGGGGGNYGLFSDAVNSPDYTESNGGINSQMTNQTGCKRSGPGPVGDTTLGFICSD
jgi:hypothetical protein